MAESIRQRKRLDESNVQSSKDNDTNRNITIDQDDHRSRNQSSLPLS